MKNTPTFIVFLFIVLYTNASGQESLSFKNYREGNSAYSMSGSESSIFVATSNGIIQRNLEGEVLEVYTTDKGLISDIVQELFVINENDFWFSTSEAVHHMVDGHCLVFDEGSGLLNNVSYSFCKDDDDNFWVANFGGFSRYKDGDWQSYAFSDSVGFKSISAYAGQIWGSTYDSGILSFDGADWLARNTSTGFPSDKLGVMRTDADGVLWIASLDSGLISYDGIPVVHYDSLLMGRTINDFSLDSTGRKWIFTDRGVIVYDTSSTWTEVQKLAAYQAVKGWTDKEGSVWLSTDKELIKYLPSEDSLSSFKIGGLSSNLVTAIKTDVGDNHWVSTSKSISLYSNNWENILFNEINPSLTNVYVGKMDKDSRGRVWINYHNPIELSYFDDSTWTVFNSGNSSLNTSRILKGLVIDSSDYVWIGSEKNGVQYYDGNSWMQLTTTKGLIHNDVTDIAVDRNNNKWIGTKDGVSSFNGSSFTNYARGNGLIDSEVTKIKVDSKNNIWVGTEAGLSMFDGNNWYSYTSDSGMSENRIRSLAIDTADNVWCGHQHGGLSMFDVIGNKWYTYGTADGLASSQINAIDVDRENNIWIGTSFGLSVARPSKVSLMVNANTSQSKSTMRKIEVPVTVNNFSRIKGISFSMNYDQTVLSFDGFKEGGLYNLSMADFDTTDVQNGVITLDYQNKDLLCQTISNHTPIIYLMFDVINSADSSEITLSSEPMPIVIENYRGEIMSYEVLSAKFSIADLETRIVMQPGIKMRVYPNPTESIVNIECKEEIEQIRVTELSGRTLTIVEGQNQSSIPISLAAFPNGLYLLNIKTRDHQKVVKLMKR